MDLYDNLKQFVDNSINSYIEKEHNIKLKEIISYSLNGGKRVRPIICLLVFRNFIGKKNINQNETNLTNFILIPEILHNISLILDDLPCMDNDQFRRNKETTHYKYGIIPSYISIIKMTNNLFMEFINIIDLNKKFCFKNSLDKIETKNFRKFVKEIICQYMNTLIDGQYYDLSFLNIDLDLEVLYKINSKKTAPLFSLSFLLGYLQIVHFDTEFIIEYKIIEKLNELGELFGFIFQLNDDIVDRDTDLEEGKNLNLAINLGYEKSIELFNLKCLEFQTKLESINLWNENFEEIIILLKKRLK